MSSSSYKTIISQINQFKNKKLNKKNQKNNKRLSKKKVLRIVIFKTIFLRSMNLELYSEIL